MAEILNAADKSAIAQAAESIRQGRLVAFGTETVYGLGANALDDKAVQKIFTAKGRPQINPLICHLPDAESAFEIGMATPLAEKLAGAFWGGAMTLVLDKRTPSPISAIATSGLETIALRVPSMPSAREFLAACQVPVAAPSANRSGKISPTRPEHVVAELDAPDLAFILDSGAASAGLESTIIDARNSAPRILRHGSITSSMIEEAIGVAPISDEPEKSSPIIAPGQMENHYAPDLPLLLNQQESTSDCVFIGFGDIATHTEFNLSPSGDLHEAAANLYHLLRKADSSGASAIAVAPIPKHGVGIAINDRLSRAAGGKHD